MASAARTRGVLVVLCCALADALHHAPGGQPAGSCAELRALRAAAGKATGRPGAAWEQTARRAAGGARSGPGGAGSPARLRGGAPAKRDVDWRAVSGSLLGGLSMFLYSMDMLSEGIQAACGNELKAMLRVLSYNRFVGFLTGIAVCAITNSLSCVAVLLVSFVSADLIPLERCLGILLGACVGSTLISYLVVFKVVDYGLLIVFVGYCMQEFSKSDTRRDIGGAIFGLGLLFFSMEVMSNAFAFMKQYPPFLNLLASMGNPYLGFVASTVFTGIIQSSGAMMAILLQLTGQGMLTMKSCFGLMLGANVGTCVTGLLAAIGRSREALRLAMALLLFRLTSALLLLPFGGQFSKLVARACKVDYASSQPSDITLMLASSHTLFNLIFALGALPFCHLGVPMIRRLIPMTPEEIALKDKNQALLAIEAKKAAKNAAREAKQAMHLAARGVAKPGKQP